MKFGPDWRPYLDIEAVTQINTKGVGGWAAPKSVTDMPTYRAQCTFRSKT
jgi:hypothetical protein